MHITLKIGRFIVSIGLIPKDEISKAHVNMLLTRKNFNRIEKLAMIRNMSVEDWLDRLISVGVNHQETQVKNYVDNKVLDFLDE